MNTFYKYINFFYRLYNMKSCIRNVASVNDSYVYSRELTEMMKKSTPKKCRVEKFTTPDPEGFEDPEGTGEGFEGDGDEGFEDPEGTGEGFNDPEGTGEGFEGDGDEGFDDGDENFYEDPESFSTLAGVNEGFIRRRRQKRKENFNTSATKAAGGCVCPKPKNDEQIWLIVGAVVLFLWYANNRKWIDLNIFK